MSNDYSIDVTHPLVVQYDSKQFIPVTPLPDKIRFSTTASGWDIFTKTNFVNSSPIELKFEEFKKKKYITASRLKTIVAKQMKGIQINEILDDTVYVNFDKLKTKKVRLQVDSKRISLAEGYRLSGAVLVEPSEAIVSGPLALIKNVPEVVTVKFEATAIAGKFDDEIPLATSLNKNISFDIEKVKIKLEAFQLEKVEMDMNVKRINFPKKKKIEIKEEKVLLVYFVRKEDLSLIDLQKSEAIVDFTSLNEKDKTIKILLSNVPDLLQKYQFEPNVIKISYGD